MPITNDARKRTEAVNELIHTEQRYLQRLRVLKSIFDIPSEMVISLDERRTLFQNLDDLITTSTTIMNRLIQSQLENCDCIGSEFLKSADDLEVLKVYCINHSKANKLFHDLMGGNKKFSRLVNEASTKPECESLQMVSFLLEPVQRLTRYPLLLRQILHYTLKDHPDHNSITESLHKSETLLRGTNEAVRALENMEKLEDIQSKLLKGASRLPLGLSNLFGNFRPSSESCEKIGFDLTGQCINGGQRWFCHSGKGSISRKDIELILFSDIMLVVRPHMGSAFELIEQPFQIQHLETTKQSPIEITFTGNDSTALSVKFEDEDETETWLHEVKQAQKKLRSVSSKMFLKPALVHFIGSMEISVLGLSLLKAKKVLIVSCMFKLGFHEAISEETNSGTVSEKIIIPIAHYHEDLEVFLIRTVKLSPNIQVAFCRLPLDFLEYYHNKETEEMNLAMSCPKTGNQIGNIKLKINYKLF